MCRIGCEQMTHEPFTFVGVWSCTAINKVKQSIRFSSKMLLKKFALNFAELNFDTSIFCRLLSSNFIKYVFPEICLTWNVQENEGKETDWEIE